MRNIIQLSLLLCAFSFSGQVFAQATYTSYFTGNETDLVAEPLGGTCLMGGASESDEAMVWFLERAAGGDVLVLRASGSDGYNDYLYSDLGVTVNSVETIVFNAYEASNSEYVQTKIANAEAIWFAGGDQYDYVQYFRDSDIQPLLASAVLDRNVVIGGTSAGMAIQGGYYFTAENGTITSTSAMGNPYDGRVKIGHEPFIPNAYLSNVITDTHYDDPDRKGRHAVFLGRILTDFGVTAGGIACDEYTAVCVDENGMARVFGGAPQYDDFAYFIRPNCELADYTPETCIAGEPLNWQHNGQALKVYKINGDPAGSNSFDLTNWTDASGGIWIDWSVFSGVTEVDSDPISCELVGVGELLSASFNIYPNPFEDFFTLETKAKTGDTILFKTLAGKTVFTKRIDGAPSQKIDISELPVGCYILTLKSEHGEVTKRVVKSF